ncbi:MAG: hypothetical protein KBS70_06550 [Bacteroidales bacterium]|nr:hypothetical protein [Candidatus Colicola equi]
MKKTFMLVSALALVAMSVAVTSCKKDKDEPSNPSACTCFFNDGTKEVYTSSDLREYGFASCSEVNAEVQMWDEGYCR